jgi:hypothetical protein
MDWINPEYIAELNLVKVGVGQDGRSQCSTERTERKYGTN